MNFNLLKLFAAASSQLCCVVALQLLTMPLIFAHGSQGNSLHKAKTGKDILSVLKMVSGEVTDQETNEPIPGVNVLVKNTTRGTVTDIDGIFRIDVTENSDTLIFSFVGYSTLELPYQGQTNLQVSLSQDVSGLNEVVVVGYGTQKKVNLTGAVDQVSSEKIDDRPVANTTQALQGVIPNLNVTFGDGRPGGNGNFNIRGTNPISNGSPLIVIDGVPGSLNMINPRDIESVSVLKDAASSAIYGARGAFGVILVTTKSPEKGKLSAGYSNNFSWSKSTVNTDFITDGYTEARIIDDAFTAAVGSSYTGYTDEDYAELKKRQTDPSLPSVVIDNRNGRDQYIYYGNTDWWHTFFRDVQPSMEHSLRFSGGGDKVNFLLSGRFYEKKGIMQINQDKFSSYNFRAKINAEVTPWLTLLSNTQFNASKYDYPGWGVSRNFVYLTVHALPSYLPVNPDGTATYRTELNNYTIGDGFSADLLHGKSKGGERNFELINNLQANIAISDAIDVVGSYSYSLTPHSSFYRRTRSPWSISPGVIDYLGYDRLNDELNLDQYHVINVYGNYNKQFGQHTTKLTLGYNQESKQNKRLYSVGNDLLSEDLNELDLSAGDQQANGYASEWALRGVFYRLNYDFDNRYLLELNGRYDGTSRFPEDSRFGFFPSVSAGWRISEENFFKPLTSVVSALKLRVSYGSLGNQEVSNYAYIPVLRNGTFSYITNGALTQYITSPNPLSPNLTWETVTSTNLGLDAALFNNRLIASADWYVRDTKDMLTKGKTLPGVFGASEPQENAADLRTTGMEVSLNWRNNTRLAGKDLSYNVGIIVSDYRSEITRFDNPSKLLSDYYVGQEVGELWGYRIDGYFLSDEEALENPIDQSLVNSQIRRAPGDLAQPLAGDLKFRDLNGDQVINNGKNTVDDHGDLEKIGSSQPRFPFSINAGASWNGFDISVFFQGIGKQNWYPGNNADKFWGPYSRPYFSFIPEDFPDKIWSPENPDAYFPRLRGYVALSGNSELNVTNDRYLQDLAYIRLKNLTVGYTLPGVLTDKVHLNRCRFYFSGENLFTLTKLETDYIDPEQAAAESNARVYPFNKTFSLGLDISF